MVLTEGGGRGKSAWSPAAWRGQLAAAWPSTLLCAGASLGGCLAAYGIGKATGLPLIDLTRDPAASFQFAPYAGFLSTLGTLLWAAAAAACLLGARAGAAPGAGKFLLHTGLLTALLCLDDAFLLHEEILPALVPVRGVEYGMYLLYSLLTAGLVWGNARFIMRTDFALLAAAIAFLAISMMMDKVLPYRAADGSVNEGTVFFEDCFKFAGIVFWLGYVARTARSGGKA